MTCPVTPEDVAHARRLLRIVTGQIQYGVRLEFILEEAPFTSPRLLHGFLVHGPSNGTVQLLQASLLPKSLKFGSAQAAGYALWDASGQLAIVADIYVNGVKVQGCTVRTGKTTGRIDLDGV